VSVQVYMSPSESLQGEVGSEVDVKNISLPQGLG